MNHIKVLFHKLDNSIIIPEYQTAGSSGFDIRAKIQDPIIINPGCRALIPTKISLEFPDNYELQIRSRSSLAIKNGVIVLNSPGTIDSDYRGEIKIILYNTDPNTPFIVTDNMRIAQGVLCPIVKAQFVLTDHLQETDRGTGGFGSTGIF